MVVNDTPLDSGTKQALIGIIFWIGLYTTPFLLTMNGSIQALETRISQSAIHAATPVDTTIATVAQESNVQ